LSRQYRFKARPWDLQRAPSVCTGCAVGCNIELHARDHSLQRMVPRENMAINNEWLCDHGRFDTLPLGTERLREPSIDSQRASWEQALDAAAKLLRTSGRAEIVASPSLTNEALNVLRAIAAGLGLPLTVWPAKAGKTRGSIADLVASTTIVLLSLDVWSELPVLALRIREALTSGAKLYFVGTGSNGLARDTAATFASADELLASGGEGLAGPVSILGVGAEDLAQRLEATGLIGQPPSAANGYAMAELPEASFRADALLLAGNEDWPALDGKHAVQLRWAQPATSAGQAILLPITHPYEQTGTVTNLEGRVQELRAGGKVADEAKPDWLALAELARALGLAAPQEEPKAALA
ncbi:MAG TPA: molybdopterin-dependent oxidoreductase, partial [Chloroflexota bacterium]|nr:molybdopterin-dependent oxidoreductase [Chloroflexota bacterium]